MNDLEIYLFDGFYSCLLVIIIIDSNRDRIITILSGHVGEKGEGSYNFLYIYRIHSEKRKKS